MIEPCSCSEITILAYFSYSSIVQDELIEFKDERDARKNRTNANCRLKDLYEKVAKAAENKYHNKSLKDNKCVFLFEYEGREFFIGYYDGVYTFGLCCYVICGNVIDFKDKTFGIRHSTCITNETFNNYADVVKMFKDEEEIYFDE